MHELVELTFAFDKGSRAKAEIVRILGNRSLSHLNGKYKETREALTLLFKATAKQYPIFNEKVTYQEIKDEFEGLNEISIQKLKGSKDEFEGETEPLEVTLYSINTILSIFLTGLDHALLEALISQAYLFSDDFSLEQEQMESYGLTSHLSVIQKLFDEEVEQLRDEEIEQILRFIENKDFILLKQVFFLILRKKDTYLAKLYNKYEKIRGKVPFPIERFDLFITVDPPKAEAIARLEIFFKDYILREGILDEFYLEEEHERELCRYQIPFDTTALLGKGMSDNIAKALEERVLAISVFRFVLREGLKSKGFRINLIVSFKYEENEIEELQLNDHYYVKISSLIKDTLNMNERTLRKRGNKDGPLKLKRYVVLRGYFVKDIDEEMNYLSNEVLFRVRDENGRQIDCSFDGSLDYFEGLELTNETEIEIQGKFCLEVRDSSHWEAFRVLDFNVVDTFEPVNYQVGRTFSGELYLENTREGLSLRTYPLSDKKHYKKIHNKILNRPINLIDYFKNKENDEFYYELKFNGEAIIEKIEQIVDYARRHRILVNDNKIELRMSQILDQIIQKRGMSPKPMFLTVGVFLNSDNELVMAYTNNRKHKIIGGNPMQKDLIERIEQIGIDKNGILAKNYFKILHLTTFPRGARLSLMGMSAISPFFYALKDKLPVFPNIFLIGIHGCGKTTMTKLMFCTLFGNEMKTADDIGSEARLTKFATESAFLLVIDDIEILEDKLMEFIKTNSTRKGKRYRLNSDQSVNKEQTYCSFGGSANSKQFLAGSQNEAFRIRCIIHDIKTNISYKTDTSIFDMNKEVIGEGPIFGGYLIKKGLEFIDNTINNDLSTYRKFIQHIRKTKEKLKSYFKGRKVRLCDTRRLDIYTYIYIGWEIWDHVFRSQDLKSDLLGHALNLNGDLLQRYVEKQENSEREMSLSVFNNILRFFQVNKDKFSKRIRVSRDPKEDGKIILKQEFINDYDKWAREHGYEILGSLGKLGELQSQLLNKEITAKNLYYKNLDTGQKHQNHAVLFCYNEILQMRGLNPEEIEDPHGKNPLKGSGLDIGKLDVGKLIKDDHVAFRDRLKEILIESNGGGIEITGVKQVLSIDFSQEIIDRLFEMLEGRIYIREHDTIRRPTIEEKVEAQKKYCEENNSIMWNEDGVCTWCGKQTYEKISLEDATSQVITACPYCRHSYLS